MENLEITFELASPVLLTYPWLALDGYLAYQTAIETLGGQAGRLLQAQALVPGWDELPVPLARIPFTMNGKEDFIYASSIGRFEMPGATGAKTQYKMFCSEGAEHNISGKAKYQIVGGQFKLRAITSPTNHSRHVRFWVRGDHQAIEHQLERIHALGKRTASGNGRVKSFSIGPVPGDWSIVHPSHGLNRPVPAVLASLVGAGGSRPVAGLAYKPPYWAKELHVPCFVPGGI